MIKQWFLKTLYRINPDFSLNIFKSFRQSNFGNGISARRVHALRQRRHSRGLGSILFGQRRWWLQATVSSHCGRCLQSAIAIFQFINVKLLWIVSSKKLSIFWVLWTTLVKIFGFLSNKWKLFRLPVQIFFVEYLHVTFPSGYVGEFSRV